MLVNAARTRPLLLLFIFSSQSSVQITYSNNGGHRVDLGDLRIPHARLDSIELFGEVQEGELVDVVARRCSSAGQPCRGEPSLGAADEVSDRSF